MFCLVVMTSRIRPRRHRLYCNYWCSLISVRFVGKIAVFTMIWLDLCMVSEKDIDLHMLHMLHKTRIHCCVTAYTTY